MKCPTRWWLLGWAGLVGLGLTGCRPRSAGEQAATSAPAATPVAATPAAAPAASAPVTPAATPADRAPATPSAAPAPIVGPKIEGVLLNPKNGVRILVPDGWEQTDSDDGSLLQLLRRETVGGVQVAITFDYSVDEQLPAETTLDTLEKDFAVRLTTALPDRKVQVAGTQRVSVAGHPALAVKADLMGDGRPLRMKQLLILGGQTFWTLCAIGPRDAFDQVVEPEFNAVAATLELP